MTRCQGQKIYGLKHNIVEISGDVTNAMWDKQGKIGLLSQYRCWMAEFCNTKKDGHI